MRSPVEIPWLFMIETAAPEVGVGSDNPHFLCAFQFSNQFGLFGTETRPLTDRIVRVGEGGAVHKILKVPQAHFRILCIRGGGKQAEGPLFLEQLVFYRSTRLGLPGLKKGVNACHAPCVGGRIDKRRTIQGANDGLFGG